MYCEGYSGILSTYQIRQGLQIAQKQLLETRTPSLFRFTFYLRVCCSVIQKIEWAEHSHADERRYNVHYSELINSLIDHDSRWWQKCYVNEVGLLQSDDPVICQLLEPIRTFFDAARAVVSVQPSTKIAC